MRVFVTGATGALGRHAVRALVAAGHDVTGLARSEDKAAQLRGDGGDPVNVSLFDVAALTEAVADHDAIANLATAIPPTAKFMSSKAWAANHRVRAEGSAAVVDAALAADVDRVIQESVTMMYPDGGSDWVTEDTPPDEFPIAESNRAAEASIERFSAAGGSGVVLRFGWFYGPGATHSEEFYAQARHHVCVQMGRADTYVSSIHMTDAATAVVAAVDVVPGTYNVVDDEPLTKRAYAAALAAAAGKRAWLRFPGVGALLLGDRTTSLTRSVRASNHRFKAATDWAPQFPSAREGWIATAAELEAAR